MRRSQPSHRPSANLLTLVPAGTTEYIAAGDSQAAVPYPRVGRDFDLQWKMLHVFPVCCYSLAVTTGKRAFRRRALRRPHPARREVPCGDTDMDWPRPGAVLHTTGSWGRSYLGVGRRAASRAWQRALSKGRHGFTVRETLPWKNTRMGLPEGNQAIRTPSRVQGLTGDPGEQAQVLGLASDCSAQSDCRGCWRNSTRVRRLGNWTGGENRRSYPRVRGNGAASVTPASSSCYLPVP